MKEKGSSFTGSLSDLFWQQPEDAVGVGNILSVFRICVQRTEGDCFFWFI